RPTAGRLRFQPAPATDNAPNARAANRHSHFGGKRGGAFASGVAVERTDAGNGLPQPLPSDASPMRRSPTAKSAQPSSICQPSRLGTPKTTSGTRLISDMAIAASAGSQKRAQIAMRP